MKRSLLAAAALAVSLVASAAHAAVIDVTHTVSGSAGAWLHEFTVTNNLPGDNDIYFFGVKLGASGIVGSPTYYEARPGTWSNEPYGGSAIAYDTVWITDYYGTAYPGTTLTGFKALDAGLLPQLDVAWFAYAYLDTYNGPGCFNCGRNPGFEGVTTAANLPSAVPEPSSWALMIAGFGLAGWMLRSTRRRSAVFG